MRSREAFIRNIYNIPGCYICTMDEDYLRNSLGIYCSTNGHYSSINNQNEAAGMDRQPRCANGKHYLNYH
jgi:hypothetical protein